MSWYITWSVFSNCALEKTWLSKHLCIVGAVQSVFVMCVCVCIHIWYMNVCIYCTYIYTIDQHLVTTRFTLQTQTGTWVWDVDLFSCRCKFLSIFIPYPAIIHSRSAEALKPHISMVTTSKLPLPAEAPARENAASTCVRALRRS